MHVTLVPTFLSCRWTIQYTVTVCETSIRPADFDFIIHADNRINSYSSPHTETIVIHAIDSVYPLISEH
jgi:hypothetical protein